MSIIIDIVTTLVAVIAVFLSYGQYERNRKTDLKIEKWKNEEIRRGEKRNDSVGKIYGSLWRSLNKLNADRIFIIQPHPLIDNFYISVSFEAVMEGLENIKQDYQNLKISELPYLCEEFSIKNFSAYENIRTDMTDKKARSIFLSHGITGIYSKRLSDSIFDWIGTIVVCYMDTPSVDKSVISQELEELAEKIQYRVPPIQQLTFDDKRK